ncbi:MAG: hypothetical protein SPJ08_00435 [Sphaerochaetaceae bacterium]|nr:hypothetical protein [Spirochaetales bacterium]MDY5967464.1 hypothetical protein [Sphaerochaetaceae bacterium]
MRIKKIIISVLIISLITGFVIISTKKADDSFKNAVLFITDDHFYSLTYQRQKDEIDKLLKENYAKLVPLVYNVGSLKYPDLKRDIMNACSSLTPTHIILSPTMLVYYLKNEESNLIAKHSRGRAKIIAISNVDKKGNIDVIFSPEDNLNVWSDIAKLDLKTDERDICFIYNSENQYSLNAFESYKTSENEKYITIDESPRVRGEKETDDIYRILFEENNTGLIITPFFNNIQLLADKIEKEKKDVLFITDSEASLLFNDKSIMAVADTDLYSVFKKAFEDVSLNVKAENETETISRKPIFMPDYLKKYIKDNK